jgi:hypothetical protein
LERGRESIVPRFPEFDRRDTLSGGLYAAGFGSVQYSLIRIPERRFFLDLTSSVEAGAFLKEAEPVLTLEESVAMKWYLLPTGDDLLMTARFGAGNSFGDAPFDHYFVLGVERDSHLNLRAHKSSIDKKGENPFGRGYFLLNWDISKRIVETRRLTWRLAPFVDIAKILNNDVWEGPGTFVDVGIQSGFKLFGATEFVLTYGKDLRSGRNVVYFGAKL